MKKLILLMALMLTFAACKTVKQTNKTDTRTDVEVKKDVTEQADLKQTDLTNTIVTDKSTLTENVEEIITTTLFSVPDSVTGAQFPLQVTTTKRVINKGNTKNISSAQSETKDVSYVTKTVDQSDYKSETKIRTEDKTVTEVKTPAWLSLGVFALIIILIVLIYFFVFKRNNVL